MEKTVETKVDFRVAAPYWGLALIAGFQNMQAGAVLAMLGLAVGLVLTGFEGLAWAVDVPGLSTGGGPFDKIKSKSDSFVNSMIDIAVPVAAVAICVTCYMMFLGKIPKTYAMLIIGGSILIGAAPSIANYLIK